MDDARAWDCPPVENAGCCGWRARHWGMCRRRHSGRSLSWSECANSPFSSRGTANVASASSWGETVTTCVQTERIGSGGRRACKCRANGPGGERRPAARVRCRPRGPTKCGPTTSSPTAAPTCSSSNSSLWWTSGHASASPSTSRAPSAPSGWLRCCRSWRAREGRPGTCSVTTFRSSWPRPSCEGPHRAGAHSSRQALAEGHRRELQRTLSRRVPQHGMVSLQVRGGGCHRGVATALQPRLPPLEPRPPHPWNFDGSAKQWCPTHTGQHLSRSRWSEGFM